MNQKKSYEITVYNYFQNNKYKDLILNCVCLDENSLEIINNINEEYENKLGLDKINRPYKSSINEISLKTNKRIITKCYDKEGRCNIEEVNHKLLKIEFIVNDYNFKSKDDKNIKGYSFIPKSIKII